MSLSHPVTPSRSSSPFTVVAGRTVRRARHVLVRLARRPRQAAEIPRGRAVDDQRLPLPLTPTLTRIPTLPLTQAGLWAVDDDEYYRGRYLTFNASVPPVVQQAKSRHKEPNNIAVHRLALRSHVSALRDALALARALGRILILPPVTPTLTKTLTLTRILTLPPVRDQPQPDQLNQGFCNEWVAPIPLPTPTSTFSSASHRCSATATSYGRALTTSCAPSACTPARRTTRSSPSAARWTTTSRPMSGNELESPTETPPSSPRHADRFITTLPPHSSCPSPAHLHGC